MMEYSQALGKVLSSVSVLDTEVKPLLKGYGQILADDIYSDVNIPMTRTSALDGYAVRSQDIKNASRETPAVLRVVETVIAGHLPEKSVTPGTAIRIMTGAVVPHGADCIVRFEDTDEADTNVSSAGESAGKVSIYQPDMAEKNVRCIGENIARGTLALPKGTIVGPGEIAVLTSIGKAEIRVIRRPVISIMATGEELISLTTPLSPGKIYDSNTAAALTLVTRYGGIPRVLGRARDNLKSITAKMQKGIVSDAIIVSGGVSRGDYDLVRAAIESIGKVVLSGVKITPGKPFSFGLVQKNLYNDSGRAIPVFALAGNPTACMSNLVLFVRPAIFKMRGSKNVNLPVVKAVMQDSIPAKKGTRSFIWVKLECKNGQYYAELTGSQKRGVLISVALADGLAVIPEDTTINKGDTAEVIVLNWHDDKVL